MSTFSSLGLAFVAATIIAPSAGAQRHSRRTSRAHPAAPSASTRPVSSTNSGCTEDCDDFSLSVVSAVLPSEAPGSGQEYVTVVIENRGSVASPASVVMIAPKNHLSLARQSAVRSLAPGERATVQLPVELGPDGTPCVAITIRSAPIAPAANPAFLAAAPPSTPAPSTQTMSPNETQWAGAEAWGFVSPFDPFAMPYGASTLGVA